MALFDTCFIMRIISISLKHSYFINMCIIFHCNLKKKKKTCVQVQQVILDCHRVLACIRLEAFVVATTASWEGLVRAIIEVLHIHRKS